MPKKTKKTKKVVKKYVCPDCGHGPVMYAGYYAHCKAKHGCTPSNMEGGILGAVIANKAKSTKKPKIKKEVLKSTVTDGSLVLVVQITIPFSFGLPEISEVLS